MKRILLLSAISLLFSIASAQTVENIRVEQDGEKLNINYRIGGSTSEQLYFVTLTCSIDNGPVFEPKSVIGDVGANIRGGKSFNTVVWNVFDDVEEVGSVEFFVKVELISDNSKTNNVSGNQIHTDNSRPVNKVMNNQTRERKIFVGYSGSWYRYVGFRVGTLGNWGVYGSYRMGTWDDYWYYDDIYGWVGGYPGSLTAGITKRLVTNEKFRLHATAGLGLGDFFDSFELEGGVVGVMSNRILLSLGFAWNYYDPELVVGFGIVF